MSGISLSVIGVAVVFRLCFVGQLSNTHGFIKKQMYRSTLCFCSCTFDIL